MACTERVFHGEEGDSGAIHSIGNGRLIGYGQGPNLVSVYAPYTSPNHFTLNMDADGRTWTTCRERNTDFHMHWAGEGTEAVRMLDYCHQDYPCLIREIDSRKAISLDLFFPGIVASHASGLFADFGFHCITYDVKGGNPIVFHTSHTPFIGYVLISKTCATVTETGANRWRITCSPGKTAVLASGGEDPGTVILGLREVAGSSLEGVRSERRSFWQRYAARRDISHEPSYVDAAIVCIKTQQSVQGGLPSCRELQ